MIHGGDIYETKYRYDFSVNISPLGLPARLWEALQKGLLMVDCYPDLYQREVKAEIARSEGVEACQVVGGNGASELLLAIVRMLMPKKAMVLAPGFYGYLHALGTLADCQVVSFLLKEENGFCLGEDFLESLRAQKPDLLILTNPNNPTGRLIEPELLERIVDLCKKQSTFLVLDECFIRLSKARPYLEGKQDICDHLFVVNAYTKLFAIPGLRAGYVLASRENCERLGSLLPEWNMSVIAQNAAAVCARLVAEEDYCKELLEVLEGERRYLLEGLKAFPIQVFDSDTNFILLKAKEKLYESLLPHSILIRDLSKVPGLSRGYYRIAVKDHAGNEALLAGLRRIYGE